MTEETTTVDLVEPHLLRLSPPPSASSELSSPSGLPSCSSADPVTTPVSACDSTTTTTSSRLAEIQDALVEVESTPASALSPRDTSSSYNCPHYHLHHHHHHLPQRLSPPPPQQQGWSSPVTLESSAVGDGVVVVVNHALPLSPSMTPPILLSPTGGDDEEDEEVPSTHTTSSSDSVANSPLSFASEDEEEEEADVGVEGTMPTEDVPTFLQSTSSDSPHSPVQHQQQTTTTTTTPEKSPSPRLSRDVSWCKQLVLFGANPNLSNLDGWHPLHLASFSGLNENLNYLISCNTNNGPQVK
ncbi:PREDICTED: uncharacterized serine-rich protein C215.13-like [Rhagoletis zephyria]|uniref:uncharacterized serine-rich protein C215.13-like n=1 Tax=Rhagoletis zephyria TaxID=28612 RepID=UPI000811A7CD|nr:PREDICTED: uncharacterized serine-rich protein C215.13-like [Rhagoletis zephyria]